MTGVIVVGALVLLFAAACISKARNDLAEELGSYAEVLKIQVQHPGNPEYMYIHVNCIVVHGGKHLTAWIPDENYPEICHQLYTIPGVTAIGAGKYNVTLQKGEIFTFEEDIIPKAIELVKKHYGKGKMIEVLPVVDNRGR